MKEGQVLNASLDLLKTDATTTPAQKTMITSTQAELSTINQQLPTIPPKIETLSKTLSEINGKQHKQYKTVLAKIEQSPAFQAVVKKYDVELSILKKEADKAFINNNLRDNKGSRIIDWATLRSLNTKSKLLKLRKKGKVILG